MMKFFSSSILTAFRLTIIGSTRRSQRKALRGNEFPAFEIMTLYPILLILLMTWSGPLSCFTKRVTCKEGRKGCV